MQKINFRMLMTIFCINILVIGMVTVCVRIITRLVFVKTLGWHNSVTEFIFFDNENMQEDGLGHGVGTGGRTEIDWVRCYPFKDELETDASVNTNLVDIYTKYVDELIASLDYYTSKALPAYDYWGERCQLYKDVIHWNLEARAEKDEIAVIHMENGYLTYQEPYCSLEEIQVIADSIDEFNNYLSDKLIPFYYVNLGSKVNPDDKQLSVLDLTREFSNENADNLIEALNERNVNTVDMRHLMKEDGLSWYSSFYVTDPHWTNYTGMWAAGALANLLNQNEGFNFDNKYFDIDSYNVTKYDCFWMGTQAQTIKNIGCSNEAYSVILPNFETKFDVEIPTDNYHECGTYAEVLFDGERFERIISSNANKYATVQAYNCIRWNNDSLGVIKNLNQTNNDKKILLLTDSFSWYLATYLACDVDEVDIIYPMTFDGSIRTYIEQNKPNVVLLMFSERNIKPIDWDTHKSQFDMR